uniref:Gamma-interferon-inducible lysosomal thiol reductase n=1 Tax=Timema bartmani TaxID=61472 RepID=A0A7R9F1V4_9NEOP|nr:unnamed protein product [Timema bartmani]
MVNTCGSCTKKIGLAVPQKSQLITASPISPVQVTVFYEALCPDSRSFFIKQLIPTFEKASRLVDIALVPYGKAKTEVVEGGGYSFMCQHGPIECEANKIHACAVVKVRHEATRLQFIACMIADNLRPTDIGQSCAEQWNIAWEPILKCATGSEGSDLLKRHGDATDALNPKATFIPTILLDQLSHFTLSLHSGKGEGGKVPRTGKQEDVSRIIPLS